MVELTVSSEGIITQAKGETNHLFEMTTNEIQSLPYSLLDKEPLREGVYTRFCLQRTGESVPMQIAIKRSKQGWNVWAEPFLADKQDELRLQYLGHMFLSLALVAEYGGPELQAHLKHVSDFTYFFARTVLGWDETESQRLKIASLLHDVGKTSIPKELLYKPDKFCKEERRFMQQHTERGYQIIMELEHGFTSANKWMFDRELFIYAKDIAMYHHENWDGTGYPTSMYEDASPLAARIVKITDVTDALLSARPYKSPWTWNEVKEELISKSGVEFDPYLVREFLQNEMEFLEYLPNTFLLDR